MAWPHCERSMACPCKYLFFLHPPNQYFFILRPTSVPTVMTSAPHPLYVLVRGVGVIASIPSRTFTSVVCLVLAPTNVTASSVTTSCAVPMALSLRFLTGAVPSVPFPFFSVGSPIDAPVKFSFPWHVKGDPADPNVAQHILLNLSPHGLMWEHSGPCAIYLWV